MYVLCGVLRGLLGAIHSITYKFPLLGLVAMKIIICMTPPRCVFHSHCMAWLFNWQYLFWYWTAIIVKVGEIQIRHIRLDGHWLPSVGIHHYYMNILMVQKFLGF